MIPFRDHHEEVAHVLSVFYRERDNLRSLLSRQVERALANHEGSVSVVARCRSRGSAGASALTYDSRLGEAPGLTAHDGAHVPPSREHNPDAA